jgi:sodium-dependent dicarboxylate transporter 2/3/5
MSGIESIIRPLAIVVGPLVIVVMALIPVPEGLSPHAMAVAAVAILMAIWWMTEAVPLAVTALLPLVLFPPLGIASLDSTAREYAHPLVFLFLGGFLMAQAMQRWKLSWRVALHVLSISGDKPASIIAGVMIATAFLSMWVSNTATAMMMLPIGQSIIHTIARPDKAYAPQQVSAFSAALMLSIAYAATIGGMGTLIGTPPNALFAGFMTEALGVEVSFARWMLIGVPAVLVLLPVAWLVLTRVAFSLPPSFPDLKDHTLVTRVGRLGPMSSGEKRVALLLCVAAIGWMTRPIVETLAPQLALSDASIAITVAVMMFVVPSNHEKASPFPFWTNFGSPDRCLLSMEDIMKIRWDVLILFGGGLALAKVIGASGLAAWIANKATALENLPWLVIIAIIAAIIVFLGELASNTAMAAIFLPIAAAAAYGLGIDPVLLAAAVALSASLGFMLPVATPPNAIIYGSGAVTIKEMLRAGFLLDVIGIIAVALLSVTIGVRVFAGV